MKRNFNRLLGTDTRQQVVSINKPIQNNIRDSDFLKNYDTRQVS